MALQSNLDEHMMVNAAIRVWWNQTEKIDGRSGKNRVVVCRATVDADEFSWQRLCQDLSENEKFMWAMPRSITPPEIEILHDFTTHEKMYRVSATVSDRSMTEWLLRYA